MDINVKPHMTPKDFFLQFAVFITLYISTVSFLNFIFEVINYSFPDNLDGYVDPYASSMRWAISVLVVMYPLFIFLSSTVSKDVNLHPEKKDLTVRKWLVYFTLFITGLTIAIDLIVLINTFLSGEVSMRFGLKVCAVLLTTAVIFVHYLSTLKDKTRENPTAPKKLAWTISIFILISLVGGLIIIGSPAKQRELREDANRVFDLQNIQGQLTNYWQHKQNLPSSLVELKDPLSGFVVPTDPATNVFFEYEKVSATKFNLCATFALPSTDPKGMSNSYGYPSDVMNENWAHDAGRVCFARTIDPESYPPITKPFPQAL